MTLLRIFTFTDWKQLDSSYNNKILQIVRPELKNSKTEDAEIVN